jgi:hypothetical protein
LTIAKSLQWVWAVPLRKDVHRYQEENGDHILATVRSRAINALQLYWIRSITEGIATIANDIERLVDLLAWRPLAKTPL